jgi:hypothetical protein
MLCQLLIASGDNLKSTILAGTIEGKIGSTKSHRVTIDRV